MKSKPLSLDKKTGALAAAAALTVGGVFAGEALRFIKSRKKTEEKLLDKGIREVPIEGYRQTPHRERILFVTLSGFLFGFVGTRAISFAIKKGSWPFADVYISKRHIHHFLPGILLAYLASVATFVSDKQDVPLAFLAGTGMGMTFDEASLLLELRDVYWTEEGVFSLQSSFVIATLLAGGVLVSRIFQRGESVILDPGDAE